MAVTLSIADLLSALRMGETDAEMAQGTRLRAYASLAVLKRAPNAPDAAHDEALIRLAGYLWDSPFAPGGAGYANAGLNSGAWAALEPYRTHTAGPVSGVESTASTPQPTPEPTPQIDEDAVNALVQAAVFPWAQVGNTDLIPTDKFDMPDIPAVYDWATAGNLDLIPPSKIPGAGSLVIDTSTGRLPAGTVVMRLGWAQTQTPVDAIFTRADNHPVDGAAVGTVSGLSVPVFPPALVTDQSLYFFIWIAAAAGQVADVRLSGGGGSLIGSGQPLTAYTYEGTVGTIWVSNQRLSAGLAAFSVSAIVAGALVLTEANVAAWALVGNTDPIPAEKLTNVQAGGGITITRYLLPMPSTSYVHRTGGALYFAGGESIWTVDYPTGTSLASMSAALKTAVLQADGQHTDVADVGVPATEALATELWGTHTAGGGTGYRIIFGASSITLALPSAAELPANERDGWHLRLSVAA